jgi:hypothetical protein
MKASVEYAFVIEILCCLVHGSHANSCPSTCCDIFLYSLWRGRGRDIRSFFASDCFSSLSGICDSVVVSGGEYCWRVDLFGFEDFYPVLKLK